MKIKSKIFSTIALVTASACLSSYSFAAIQFPPFATAWKKACAGKSSSVACTMALKDNRVLRWVAGENSGTLNMLFVDFAMDSRSGDIGYMNCTKSICTATLSITNVGTKPWTDPIFFSLETPQDGLPEINSDSSVNFRGKPLAVDATIKVSVRISVPIIEGNWDQLWVMNDGGVQTNNSGDPGLETTIQLAPSGAKEIGRSKYIGKYENLLRLKNWDVNGSGVKHR